MTKAYISGFLSKCASSGMSPRQAGVLLKLAAVGTARPYETPGVAKATRVAGAVSPPLGGAVNFFGRAFTALPDAVRLWRNPASFRRSRRFAEQSQEAVPPAVGGSK